MTVVESAAMKRYLVLTLRTPQFDPAVLVPHCLHLDQLRARGQLELSGPFADRSGGAYLVRAASLDEAQAIAFSDPVHVTGSSRVMVYEWNVAQDLDPAPDQASRATWKPAND
jgi:uncharacterized protein YciI